MLTFLNRYLKGQHEQVWDELFAEGDAIQQEPLLSDALAVTHETMRRVRVNIELIIDRLNVIGYAFGIYPNGRTKINGYTGPHHPPPDNIDKDITELERLEGIGKLPLSLKMFWQIVGEVDLIGFHPLWPAYSDPLVIYPIDFTKYDYDNWRFMAKEGDVEAGLFGIRLAPDYFHKDNVSGGAPYMILVPNAAIDGIIENERNETTFVNYLRICFHHGGFPGLQWQNGIVPNEISGLSIGLLPI